MKAVSLFIFTASLILAGCGATEEKLDPRFQSAFDGQADRSGKTPTAHHNSATKLKGQSLPPGATPPPAGQ